MVGGTYISRAATPALFEARTMGDEEDDEVGEEEDEAELARNRNVVFNKDATPLESRISRIFYLNAYGNEIFPRANPQFVESLSSATTSVCRPRDAARRPRADLHHAYRLIYSPGSLYTSIIPCLALRGVGEAIATSPTLRAKILFLNSTLDRETPGYTAMDFVEAIRSACSAHYGEEHGHGRPRELEAKELISHVVYIEQGEVQVEVDQLQVSRLVGDPELLV